MPHAAEQLSPCATTTEELWSEFCISLLPSGLSLLTRGGSASFDLWFNYILAFEFLKNFSMQQISAKHFLYMILRGRFEFIILIGSKKIE